MSKIKDYYHEQLNEKPCDSEFPGMHENDQTQSQKLERAFLSIFGEQAQCNFQHSTYNEDKYND